MNATTLKALLSQLFHLCVHSRSGEFLFGDGIVDIPQIC